MSGEHHAVDIENIDGLYSYALVLTRNRTDAEDLVQETYLRAIGAKKELRPNSNLRAWMFTILRNVWLNQVRRRRTGPQVISADGDQQTANSIIEPGQGAHQKYESNELRDQVRAAIMQLPEEFSEIILLREYEELPYQEIATVLNCPIGTVMSRLARARSRLRVLLSALLTPAQNK
jgi:RNA polymerase sigma-70 factor (ECF subfamily)